MGSFIGQGITLYTGTTTRVYVATTANLEGSCIATSSEGSMTIPPSFWMPGRSLLLKMGGTFQTPATPGDCTIRLKGNSTQICFVTLTGTPVTGNSTVNIITGEIILKCESAGAAGTLSCTGTLEYQPSVAIQVSALISVAGLPTSMNFGLPLFLKAPLTTKLTPVVMDMTVPITLDVTESWSTASASQGTTITSTILQGLS